MISTYLKDAITIDSYSIDAWGVKTKTSQKNVPCRIEDSNKLILGQDGQEVLGNGLIFLKPTVSINYNDVIIITKKKNITMTDDREYIIKKISLEGGFKNSHYEVII